MVNRFPEGLAVKRGSPVCPQFRIPVVAETQLAQAELLTTIMVTDHPLFESRGIGWRLETGNWKYACLDDSAGVRIRHDTEAKTTSGKRDLKRGGIASVLGFFFRRRASTVYEDMRYESRSTQREMVSANLVAAAAARLRLVQNRTDRAGTCDSS